MRILLVQRSLRPPGGGNAVAAWMAHALAPQHEVSTLTIGQWSIAETNAFYGTSIPNHINRIVVRTPWRWLGELPDNRFDRLRMCAVLREARTLARQFDLLVTADNYAPFAKPGLQYLHFPADLQPTPTRMKPIVDIYFRLCDRVLGAAWIDAAKNITLANSQWTAAGLERRHEMSTPIVLYPPVLDPGAGLPWEQRDDLFLCVGRFDGSKRIEMAISIVHKIRASVLPAARLLIIGSPVDTEYTTRIHGVAARAGDWIEFHEDLSRADLNALMGRSRYGIQAMHDEHFGLATAEMTRAGCMVFAHRSGGSPEVLDNEDDLLWTSEDEAVEKFARMRRGQNQGLPAHVAEHARSFSSERFVEELRGIVARSAREIQDR